MPIDLTHPDFEELTREIFEQRIPFNQVLGLEIEHLGETRASMRFRMREELVGNYRRQMLHGGVIAATLDATAGLLAYLGAMKRLRNASPEKRRERFNRIGTIDLRVDYLRPGIGERFVASAMILRSGNRIAVIHTELHNDRDELIASGTCTYIVG